MVKIGKIADWLGVSAPLLEEEITEVASVETAGPGAVVFAENKEAMARALESRAGAILANRSLEVAGFPLDPRVLWVGDARYAFAVVGQRLRGREFKPGIHPSAVVGQGVRIGEGTSIGPGVVLEEGAVI